MSDYAKSGIMNGLSRHTAGSSTAADSVAGTSGASSPLDERGTLVFDADF